MKKKILPILMLLIFSAVSVGLYFGVEKNFRVAVNSTLGNECAYIINRAVGLAVEESPNLTELLKVEKNDMGIISYFYVDHSLLNELSLKTMEGLEDEMLGLKNIDLSIPVGNLIMSRFLAGRGPQVKTRIFPQGGIGIDYHAELSDAGINQVLFHLDMMVTVQLESVFGLHHYTQTVNRTVPVCDIVIVGNVPETYANLPAETDFLNLVP